MPQLLWKNQEDLTEEQRENLEKILDQNPCLRIAYEFKEEIREIYQGARTVTGARRRLEKWSRLAGILYQQSAKMIEGHLAGICHYFDHHTTNGMLEGINTKIKLLNQKSQNPTNERVA